MLCFTFQKDNVGTAFQDIHVKKWEFSGHPPKKFKSLFCFLYEKIQKKISVLYNEMHHKQVRVAFVIFQDVFIF